MIVKETALTEDIMIQLISLSEDWEKENSCHGYHRNSPDFIKRNRIFLAMEGDTIVGYLFGHKENAQDATSIYKKGTTYFEIEELYVKPHYRSRGIGKMLFQHVENEVTTETDLIILSTATKNFRAILHFYIDELGMEFWNAQLFKRIQRTCS